MGVLQFKRGNLVDLPTLQEGEAYVVEDKDKVYMNINGNTRVFEAKPTALAVTVAQDFSERDLSFVDFDGSTALDDCIFAGTNLTGAKNFPYATRKLFLDALISAHSLSSVSDLITNGVISGTTKFLDGGSVLFDRIKFIAEISNDAGTLSFDSFIVLQNTTNEALTLAQNGAGVSDFLIQGVSGITFTSVNVIGLVNMQNSETELVSAANAKTFTTDLNIRLSNAIAVDEAEYFEGLIDIYWK